MAYIDKFIGVYEHQKNKISKKLKKYETRELPDNPINLLTNISGILETIAIGDYIIDNDMVSMRNNFYNAAIAQEKAIRYFDSHEDIKPSGFISMLSLRELLKALISDSEELVIRFADLMGGRGELDTQDTDKYTYHLGYALKYVVLNKYKEAKMHIEKIKNEEQDCYCEFLEAIVVNNQKWLNDSLLKILKDQRMNKQAKGTPHELLSTTTIALAKLAKMKGFEVNVDEDIAPREVIQKLKVQYELLDILKI